MFKSTLCTITLLCLITNLAWADKPLSFYQAKRKLIKVYQDQPVSFYCNCDYTGTRKLKPDWESCGFTPRKQVKRGSRIEWEHVMPAHQFGHQLQCWKDGGRRNCRRDLDFRAMEGDMHNLVPAIGEVNGDRSNYQYGIIEGEERVYGACDAEVNFKAKQFEPAPEVRGDIARIYFYMADRHGVVLEESQRQMFAQWAADDPVSDWKRERNQRIAEIQGNTNPYVDR